MANIYKAAPNLETGYLLELDKGWFGVIRPTATINLIVNPNFVNYPEYPLGGLDATNITPISEGVFSPSGINVKNVDWGLSVSPLQGLTTVSFYIRSSSVTTGTVNIPGFITNRRFAVTEEYSRVHFTFNFGDTLGTASVLVGTDNQDFDITAVQAEAGTLTTFFSGDTEPNYYEDEDSFQWSGATYRSASYRSESAFSSGEVVSLIELGFNVTEVSGLGYSDLTPTTYEQALSNTVLYSCSSVEHREIEISGIIQSCSYSELMCSLGKIGELLYQTKRPVRIQFTPYENCDDDVPCVMFDFLYLTGLNEPVETLYGQEVTIEGMTLDPCLYSCEEYSFATVDLESMVINGEERSLFFIKDDNTAEEVIMPDLTANVDTSTLIKAIECNGSIYAIMEQHTTTNVVQSHLVVYNGATWTSLAHTTVETGLAGPNTTASRASSYMSNIVCTEDEINGATVWVSGQWSTATFTHGVGVGYDGSSAKSGLVRYLPRDNKLYHYDAQNSNVTADRGLINGMAARGISSLIIGGSFTEIFDGEGNTSTSHNVAKINLRNHEVSSLTLPGFVGTFPGRGSNLDTPPTFTPVGPGISGQYLAELGTIYEVYVDIPNVFFIGNGESQTLTNPLDSTHQAYVYHYEYDPANAAYLFRQKSFPFYAQPFPLDIEGYATHMLKWGNGSNYFMTGYFTQATSHLNGVGYSDDNNYLSNAAYFNADGFNKQFSEPRWGSYDSLGRSLNSSGQSYIQGFYEDATSFTGNIRPDDDNPYVNMVSLGNRVLFFGNFRGYGRSDDKQTACGFVEYIPRSTTNLSYGTFVPSVYEVDATNPLHNCWANAFVFDNVTGIKMLVGAAKSSFGDTKMYYNSGMTINTCTDNNTQTTAEIIIDTDQGITDFSGIVNATTGASIYVTPKDLPANSQLRLTIYNDYYIKLTATDGSKTVYASYIINTGNPFAVSNGDVLQVIFALSDTRNLGTGDNNPSFTAQYKTCYNSYAEFVTCNGCS